MLVTVYPGKVIKNKYRFFFSCYLWLMPMSSLKSQEVDKGEREESHRFGCPQKAESSEIPS